MPEPRRWLFRIAWLALALALAAGLPPVAAAEGPSGIRTPGDAQGKTPAVLERIAATDSILAFAISSDGEQAALAAESTVKPGQTDLTLFSTALDEPRSTRLSGLLRDVLFATDGSVLYGILHRVAKRTGGDTHLVLIDPATLKTKRANRLPLGATDLDHWVTAQALLIAAPSEIRTLLLPDLRSGPLFAVTGANRAIAALGGSSLVLVGQADGMVLVDLEDRPGIDEMPVRDRLSMPGPVEGLAAAIDGRSALARLAGGELYTVELGPLRIRPAGNGTAVAAPPVATVIRSAVARIQEPPAPPPTPPVMPPPVDTDKPAPTPARPPAPPATPETASPSARPAPENPPPSRPTTETPKSSPPANPVETAKEPAPQVVPEKSEDKPSVAPPQPAPKSNAQVSGRVTGPAAGLVRFVVLRGPNNLLREAARVAPAADGTWGVDGLAVGRYRVQLDAGGGRVLISKPPFAIVDIGEDRQATVPDIEALREL